MINLPAMFIAGLVTMLLVIGPRESATVNAFLVVIKVAALTLFVIPAVPPMTMENFEPFAPLGIGRLGAPAASLFFASAIGSAHLCTPVTHPHPLSPPLP